MEGTHAKATEGETARERESREVPLRRQEYVSRLRAYLVPPAQPVEPDVPPRRLI